MSAGLEGIRQGYRYRLFCFPVGIGVCVDMCSVYKHDFRGNIDAFLLLLMGYFLIRFHF